jgi:BMFP domain-containing protein YqiC
MSTKKQQQQITWRSQVLELTSKGHNQSDIARILQVDKSVICRDMTALNQQSKQNIQKHIDEKLPNEYEKCLIALTVILRESWDMSQQPDIDRREKIQSLSLAKECYTTKLELLTYYTTPVKEH